MCHLNHLAKSLATVSLGQVTKAAECVPDVYVSDAMEKALSPTVLSSWNINRLRSTVWQEKWINIRAKHVFFFILPNLMSQVLEEIAHSPKAKLLRIHPVVSLLWANQCALPEQVRHTKLRLSPLCCNVSKQSYIRVSTWSSLSHHANTMKVSVNFPTFAFNTLHSTKQTII